MKLISCLFALGLLASACGGDSTPTAPSANVPFSTVDLRIGTGAEATAGRAVTVNYSGWLYNSGGIDNKGTRFDAGTFPFTVGATNVIPGFSQGTLGMRVGGLRRVIVPPNLAYGSQGSGSIPPNATLIFEIELVSVQ